MEEESCQVLNAPHTQPTRKRWLPFRIQPQSCLFSPLPLLHPGPSHHRLTWVTSLVSTLYSLSSSQFDFIKVCQLMYILSQKPFTKCPFHPEQKPKFCYWTAMPYMFSLPLPPGIFSSPSSPLCLLWSSTTGSLLFTKHSPTLPSQKHIACSMCWNVLSLDTRHLQDQSLHLLQVFDQITPSLSDVSYGIVHNCPSPTILFLPCTWRVPLTWHHYIIYLHHIYHLLSATFSNAYFYKGRNLNLFCSLLYM